MVLLLAACSQPCPSFGEVAIEDHTTGGDGGAIADVERALADFAAWTGREGVCVATVRVEDALTAEGDAIAGQYVPVDGYDGRRATTPGMVKVAAVGDPYVTVVHELCHAVDELEGYSLANPDIFDPKAIPKDIHYDTGELRVSEAFALACEGGPHDVSVGRWMERTCGEEFISDEARFLATQVYTSAPLVTMEEGHVPAWEVAGAVEVPEYAYAGSWAMVGDTLVGAGDALDADAVEVYPALFVWDDADGPPDRTIDLRAWNPAIYDPLLADAKDRVIVLTMGTPAPILELDPADGGIRTWPASVNKFPDGAAFVAGGLYVSEYAEGEYGHVARIDEQTGERTELYTSWAEPAALDAAGWIEVDDEAWIFRQDGGVTRHPLPAGVAASTTDGVTLDFGLVYEKHGQVDVGLDGSTVIVPDDACTRAARPLSTFYWNGRRAGVSTEDFQHYNLWRLGG